MEWSWHGKILVSTGSLSQTVCSLDKSWKFPIMCWEPRLGLDKDRCWRLGRPHFICITIDICNWIYKLWSLKPTPLIQLIWYKLFDELKNRTLDESNRFCLFLVSDRHRLQSVEKRFEIAKRLSRARILSGYIIVQHISDQKIFCLLLFVFLS
jgi:hypothetical protein